jgi:major membrane immunogen (membrane-anchored lipoprotein)
MKKIIVLFSLLIAFSCEDKNEEEVVNLNGTYKISEASEDCTGLIETAHLTIDDLSVVMWGYDYDDCDSSAGNCYYKDFSLTFTKDGDALTAEFTTTNDEDNDEGQVSINITRSGTNGLKVDYTFSDGSTTMTDSKIWDFEAAEVKTYSPVCEDED